MGVIEKAISWMEGIANDDSHGYDQTYRWGNQTGDYDCSSLVISAWEQAGVKVKSAGATYTGNMYSIFKSKGFKDVTNQVNRNTGEGLRRGDVLLNVQNHTAMYCGNGLEVEASINEFGGITGGQPGDQTGREIRIGAYRNYPWDYVLRYQETSNTNNTSTAQATTQKQTSGSLVEVNTSGSVKNVPKVKGKVIDTDPLGLNVRYWAGVQYDKCSFSGLKYGTIVEICDAIYADDKVVWYFIKYNGKWGFVCGDYIQKA